MADKSNGKLERVIVESSGALVGYACPSCTILHAVTIYTRKPEAADIAADIAAQGAARECCDRRCGECGKPAGKYRTMCGACISAADDARDAKRMASAVRVPAREYGGPLVCVGDDDYRNPDDCEDLAHAWATAPSKLHLDAGHILESALEEHHEDAYDDIGSKDFARLQRYLDAWCEHVGVVSYHADHTRLVVFDDAASKSGEGS